MTTEELAAKQRRQDLRDLYDVLKASNLAAASINWDKFAEHAEKVGLHYHPVIGLMDKSAWDAIKDLVKEPA